MHTYLQHVNLKTQCMFVKSYPSVPGQSWHSPECMFVVTHDVQMCRSCDWTIKVRSHRALAYANANAKMGT